MRSCFQRDDIGVVGKIYFKKKNLRNPVSLGGIEFEGLNVNLEAEVRTISHGI